MTFESWAAFTAASAVLLIIPGPTVLLVVSYALGQGWRTALPTAIGVALGDFTAMTLSMLGIGALLATSAMLFTALQWIGLLCAEDWEVRETALEVYRAMQSARRGIEPKTPGSASRA